MNATLPAFKQTQVYTWELEPSVECPSHFSSFTFSPTSARPSDFQDSSFMDPAPHRLSRRRKWTSARLIPEWVLASLCILTILGILVGVPALSA
jgi:hypothetical protein